MSNLKYEYNDEIICPYCDYQFQDSWEYHDADGELVDCRNCSKDFHLTANHETTYSTSRKDGE